MSTGGEARGRRILANLDFEEELRAVRGGGGPARPLSAPARRAAAEAGALLRVFAREGDRLWLPAAVAAERLPRLPGLPAPVLESGPLEALPPADRVLAWGEGPRVAALRLRWRAREARDPGRALRAPLHEAVWQAPVPAPEAVARVAHRGFALALGRDLGTALPGARLVADVAEIEGHLASGAARAGGGCWVVKAPYSAAGRERHVASPADDPRAAPLRRRLERLLERHGALLFEPWLERTADFGCAGLVTGEGARLASIHRQEVGRRGAFRAISRLSSPAGDPGLTASERDLLESTFYRVADGLREAGYRGPFGIDAYRWRRPDGTSAFHPLGEINPRLTLGLVARALAERAAGPAGMGRERPVIRM